MKYYILAISLLSTLNFYSQNSLDTIQNLKSIYISNMGTYISKPVKNILDDFPYEIKGVNMVPFNGNQNVDPKINCFLLFVEDRIKPSIDSLLEPFNPSTNSSQKKQYIVLYIYLENIENHLFYDSLFEKIGLGGNNWKESVREELSLPKYTVKSLKLSGD